MLRLMIIEHGKPGRVVAVRVAPITIGSLGLCTIQLKGKLIAPEHAELIPLDRSSLKLRVRTGTSAVHVHGITVRERVVRAGDVIELDGALVVVEDGHAPETGAVSVRQVVFAAADRIFHLADKLLAERPVRSLLVETLDVARELFGASRGLLLSLDAKGKGTRVLARHGDWPEGKPPRMSRTLLARIIENPVPVLVADVLADPAVSTVASIALEVRSMVAGPLLQRGQLLGIVYLESPEQAEAFGEPEREFLERFCQFTARLLTRACVAGELKEEKERLLELHQRSLEVTGNLEELIGESPAMQQVKLQIRQVAPTDVTSLIIGESGTGKELVAQAIHRLSHRASKPFVAVNCAALPEELVESELFGHVAGAFSGAQRDRLGRFELAHTGTLFLDEVGDLPLPIQVKLLRVLQERTFQRLGEAKDRTVDVRIIAATNAVLPERIREERFREDLFFRLSVFQIPMPALRQRITDVPALVDSFIRRFAPAMQRPVTGIDEVALASLCRYTWPGNVRELSNLVQQALVRETGSRISPSSLVYAMDELPPASAEPGSTPDFGQTFDVALNRYQLWFLKRELERAEGDISLVLERTALSKASLYRKCAALGLEPARFRKSGRP